MNETLWTSETYNVYEYVTTVSKTDTDNEYITAVTKAVNEYVPTSAETENEYFTNVTENVYKYAATFTEQQNVIFLSTNVYVTSYGIINGNMSSENGSMLMPDPPDPASMDVIVLLSLLFIVIGCVGLLGNCLVIIVILVDRKMRNSVTNIFIMNLAIADFLIMLFGVPEIVQFMLNCGWLIGEELCKVNRFILVVSLYVSILSLVTVCIERFVAIVYPIKAHILCGRKKIMFAIALIWPIALGCGLPTAFFNTVTYPAPFVPFKHCIILFPELHHFKIFQFTEFVLFYFIPVTIQVILYAVIGKRLYASTEELHTRFQMRPGSNLKNDRTSETIRARKDVVKMLAASVLVYIICYAPPQILLFYDTFSSEPFQITWSFRVFSIVISNVNSAANPVLYSIFSQNFRRNFKKCLCYVCLRTSKDYQRARFDSFDSRGFSRKVSSSRATTVSRL